MTLADEELCGTELGRNEPGTRLGRPSEAGIDAGGTADRRSDPGARLGRSRTSAVALGVASPAVEATGDTNGALGIDVGPRDCAGFALLVLEVASAEGPLLIDAGGLESVELGSVLCDGGALGRTLDGAVALVRTEAARLTGAEKLGGAALAGELNRDVGAKSLVPSVPPRGALGSD